MKRFLLILLTAVLLLPCLAACKGNQNPSEDTTPQEQTPPPGATPLDLVKDGASEYVIVRSANLKADDPAFLAALLLRYTV